jgi:hypothetical protein
MKIKPGVKIGLLKPQMVFALVIVDHIFWHEYGYRAVLTSGNDGKHKDTSLHYKGYAVDIRRSDIEREDIHSIHEDMVEALGKEFDVVLESTHWHIEYQPKNEKYV